MSGQQIGTVVGQAVGYYFAGPIGAAVVPAIGLSVGAALDDERLSKATDEPS